MKKKLKISKNIIVLGIFIYIFFNIINFFVNKSIETQALEYSTLEEKIKKIGVLIRQEVVVISPSSGEIEYKAKQGDKIKKEQSIVNIYDRKLDKKTFKKIEELDKEIKDTKKDSVVSDDIKKIDSNIESTLNEIKHSINSKDLINVDDNKKKLDNLIEKKEVILNKGLLGKNLENKVTQKKYLEDKVKKYSNEIKAPISGILSFSIDEYEEKLNYKKMGELKVKDIENIENSLKDISNKTRIKKSEKLLKLVDNHKFYIAVCLNDKEVSGLEVGKKVTIKAKKEEVEGKVYIKQKEKKDKNLAIFEISQQNIDFYDTRVQEFDIIYKQLEGLKIPKTSVVENKNKKGVFVISEIGSAKFKELQGISGEDDEFYIVDYYKNKAQGVHTVDIHDEIVMDPDKVKEGEKIK